MKKKLVVFPVLFCLLLLIGCSKSTEVEDGYTTFYITIANNSSFNITELVISMVGIEDIQQISVLAAGEISHRFEYHLPERPEHAPISYGDYNGSYLQNGIENLIFIPMPEINILVHIIDDGYTVEDVTN